MNLSCFHVLAVGSAAGTLQCMYPFKAQFSLDSTPKSQIGRVI